MTVFSFETWSGDALQHVQIEPAFAPGGKYSFFSYLFSGRRLRDELNRHKIDVLNPLNVTPYGVWGMESGFHPVIVSALGADILEFPPDGESDQKLMHRYWNQKKFSDTSRGKQYYGLRRKFFRHWISQTLMRADFVTGDNQVLLDALQNWFSVPFEKLRLLRWGIEPEKFVPDESRIAELRKRFSIQPGQKVILSPRGLKPVYQADIILDAFDKVLQQNPDQVKCIMLSAGYGVDADFENRLNALAQIHSGFLWVREGLCREDMHQLWNLVDVFVSAPVFDGYSAVLSEGRYAGAIPVVNDIPATREILEDGQNALFVQPFTAENLAIRLNYALKALERLKTAIAPRNKTWIEENSILAPVAAEFLAWAVQNVKK